ncbi:MAG: TolC family protein, partial [Bacteroidia bacterium]|nr:TolC family protein [Bacteroidia bacterium]
MRYFLINILYLFCFLITAKAQEVYTLQAALKTAKKNNPTLKEEQVSVAIAQADVITAKLKPNPTLNNQSLQMTKSSHFYTPQWYGAKNRQIWWQFTKPFQIAGQRQNRIAVANKNVSLIEKKYNETERNLFLDVSEKWLEVYTAQKQWQIIQIAKSNIDSLVYTNQIRYKNQVISQTDLARTELLAKQYNIQNKTALQEIKNRQSELTYLLGVQTNVVIDTADSFLFTISQNLDSLIKESLQTRSDVQIKKSLISLSESNIKLQKSLAYPKPEVGTIYNPQNTIPYAGIYATIDIPVFSRNQGEIKKSYLLKEQAEKSLQGIQAQIQTEITVAFADYELQKKNIESYKKLLDQSQSILDNVKYAYLKGGTTIIDFLEAQRSWLETQQEYYNSMHAYKQS